MSDAAEDSGSSAGPVIFRISAEVRRILKEPCGVLYRGNGPEVVDCFRNELERSHPVISVGDVTTANLIGAGIFPDICFVDSLTKREPVSGEVSEKTAHEIYREMTVRSPAGALSEEMIIAVYGMYDQTGCGQDPEKSHLRIAVEGEEDLATIPAVAFSEPGAAVLYGQPDEGVVFVKVTPEKKQEMLTLLKRIVSESETSGKAVSGTIRRILDEAENRK
ncbi:GTP-dependent dephospho-CoA kinase family protein [Methanosarcinaceae archaeon]|nr:GTP-dependent dephospho-CoA kinase family protein [Methanosarcinaceae archaeon]MBQ3620696.1 GTP-dependent dephospho-CoA kinase family protein [Methanosarcinaceae archaeon]